VVVAVEDEDQQWRTIVDGRVAVRPGGLTLVHWSLQDIEVSILLK